MNAPRSVELHYNGTAAGVLDPATLSGADGLFAYIPYRSGTHACLQLAIREGSSPKCTCTYDGVEYSFVVDSCPEYGKLVFAFENQGVWIVATETHGDDPPVYVSEDDQPFKLLCDSLSQFLVTFCLHESLFGAFCLSSVEDVDALNAKHSKVPIPLWLDGPYVSLADGPGRISFHLVDGCILQADGWCGGRKHDIDAGYADFFPHNDTHRPADPPVKRYLWDIPEAPKLIKTRHLSMLIERPEANSRSHLDKAQFYREALRKVEAEP